MIAMMRMAHGSGFGNHPGVLFIDSPGSEELSDEDLVAMMGEIAQVAEETLNLQIFLASARSDILAPAIATKNIKPPAECGAMFLTLSIEAIEERLRRSLRPRLGSSAGWRR